MRLLTTLGLLALPHNWAAVAADNSSRPADVPDLTKLQYIRDSQKPRVFVLTDILNEPDDQQSVVRYLLYSNEFDTQALCATTSTWLRDKPRPEAIEKIVEAYGEVVDNLNKHVHPQNQYPPVDKVLSLITSGPAAYGKEAFSQPLSNGSALLIERLRESQEPLWVLIWGGSVTLAQALHHMSESLSEADFAALRSRIRVYAISDQDDTGEWIRNTFPDIFYIASIHAFSNYAVATWRGMWEGLQRLSVDKVSMPWVHDYIKMGPLGAVYPSRPVGVEGDTPSFLYLINNGLGVPEHPTYGSWGGRWGPTNVGGMHYSDAGETFYAQDGTNETNSQVSVARWRDHFQNDMATRMRWSISPNYSNGTHPPVPRVNGTIGPAPLRLHVLPGSEIVLDASGSFDPDHPADSSQLAFEWFQYREADYLVRPHPEESRVLDLAGLGAGAETPDPAVPNDEGFQGFVRGDAVKVAVPGEEPAYEYHLILKVTSTNHPELPVRRYLRVLILASRDMMHPDECCDAMVIPEQVAEEWD